MAGREWLQDLGADSPEVLRNRTRVLRHSSVLRCMRLTAPPLRDKPWGLEWGPFSHVWFQLKLHHLLSETLGTRYNLEFRTPPWIYRMMVDCTLV